MEDGAIATGKCASLSGADEQTGYAGQVTVDMIGRQLRRANELSKEGRNFGKLKQGTICDVAIS